LSSYGKILFRGLGCRPMEKSFLLVTIDLVVVLWMHVCTCVFFFCHRLDCRLMEISFPMDLVVAPWRISGLMDLVVVLWRIFCSMDLVVILRKIFFVPMDLIVVLWKILGFDQVMGVVP
jgi:hypothetical protein